MDVDFKYHWPLGHLSYVEFLFGMKSFCVDARNKSGPKLEVLKVKQLIVYPIYSRVSICRAAGTQCTYMQCPAYQGQPRHVLTAWVCVCVWVCSVSHVCFHTHIHTYTHCTLHCAMCGARVLQGRYSTQRNGFKYNGCLFQKFYWTQI